MIRHPVQVDIQHHDYIRVVAWASALGITIEEAAGCLLAAGIGALEGLTTRVSTVADTLVENLTGDSA